MSCEQDSPHDVKQEDSIKVSTAYDKETSDTYDEKRFVNAHGRLFASLEVEQFRSVLDTLTCPSRIIEVGCGTGRFIALSLTEEHEVYGVDPSPNMLRLAAARTNNSDRVHLQEAEGAAIPFPDKHFDFVYTIRTINQVESKTYAIRMIEECIRVSRDGGRILLEFVNSRSINADGMSNKICVQDIRQLLAAHPTVRLSRVTGILFWSLTALNLTPQPLLPLFRKVDAFFSRLWPEYCTRCYVLLEKSNANGA